MHVHYMLYSGPDHDNNVLSIYRKMHVSILPIRNLSLVFTKTIIYIYIIILIQNLIMIYLILAYILPIKL